MRAEASSNVAEAPKQSSLFSTEAMAPVSMPCLRIDLAAQEAGAATLRVSYSVRGARWQPIYDARLGNRVAIPARVADSTSAWAIYAILLPDAAARDRLQAGLRQAGVPSAIYYPKPLHRQPAYAAAHDGAALPVSEDLATRIVALPIHPDLTDAQAHLVCDAVLAGAWPPPAARAKGAPPPSAASFDAIKARHRP